MSKRKQPTLTQKLDAALLTLLAAQGRALPIDQAKALEDGA